MAAVTSPLVRRMHLGQVVRGLRQDAGMTHADLVQATGLPRQTLSRMENADRKPNLAAVIKILHALSITEATATYQSVIRLAMDAAETGWWDRREHLAMGDRQRTVADLEHGASSIRQYQSTLLPGLLQTPDYARYRAEFGGAQDVEATVRGRMRRQALLTDAEALSYTIIAEEQVVRRLAVPPQVMLDQLQHLLTVSDRPAISLRILPVDGRLGDGYLPRSPFALYDHAGGDPVVAVIDTVDQDLVDPDPGTTARYAQLFDRLCVAALSEEDSAKLIQEVANSLATEVRS
nr:helix-turn-helix transcriptional regulator [Micromonospora sp. DSM 115978]